MFLRRLAVAGLVAAAAVPAVPTAALAHGAPVTPISRSAACGGNGSRTGAAACVAARKATGGRLGAYDNVRLAGVNGADRERVPDGQLCSAGIALYEGLDLPRDDFPATGVRSGQRLAVSYRGTIPHRGSFRIYLTKKGYDPGEKLTWDDLGAEPLAEITDPPLTGGAYRMRVTLPQRTGRHLLYVVWETSSTPDTYYSCSDLTFPVPAVKKAAATKKPSPSPSKTEDVKEPVTEEPEEPQETTAAPESSGTPTLAAIGASDDGTITLGHWLIVGALTTAALVTAGAGVTRMRRLKKG
ncbi:putative chitin-binding protein [Actinoplanes missouriensis 431]|uniref:Putative chitin-binding protein n=1 Tax=Actinoplanes missouriensis (strain ATCC 14538 / DSM 43046 / CBS 188.64 / JCM 3121 / NBRC 102363 / NCIMB 12654 / NRRL B-3342 / UNCC 431) TaxID=512565 RepID=I0HBN9_ACTM4|nr:lytic polysaccharide monooxygenase [Actinoplanes missouriensis]BAL90426.1 putative chitin-binding protein [Actinoplanes missouriensis 431]